jgi:type 1 fimbria pilin
MRTLTTILFLSSVYFFTSCNTADENNPQLKISADYCDTISIKVHETVHAGDESSTLTFNSVLEDSRCPADVVCIWAGNAKASFTFTTDSGEETFLLNTLGGSDMPSDTVIGGFRIKLDGLNPAPISTNEIKPDSYEASVVIKLDR